ncbi:hypothetical protein RXV86_06020 [Alisedimentitalea sp. MJ-SS2]|nr:hypothetical protein [Alisedimentitalea sp. MJ-SS2]
MGKNEALRFEIFMPKGKSGRLRYNANGTGRAVIVFNRCKLADPDHASSYHFGPLKEEPTFTDSAPARDTGCDYGFMVKCAWGACSGTISVKTWIKGGQDTTVPATGTPTTQPDSGTASDYHGKPLAAPGSKIADAGGQNMSAAFVPYNCEIKAQMAQSDYDFYAFDFPGGTLHAASREGLNLVADLIRASDGAVLMRNGVDTGPFRISAELAPGRCILAVRVMHHAGSGPYAVTLGRPGSCRITETQ